METILNLFNLARESDLVFYCGLYFSLFVLFPKLIGILRLCWTYSMPAKADFVKFADGGYALITGGAGGIGKATAVEFAQRGIDLYLMDFNGTLLEKTLNE